MIYFDNSATSYFKPMCVKFAVNDALNCLTANPGRSGHLPSIKAGEMVFETREIIKQFFNAQEYQVIFTKNCTEALNLAIFGCLKPGDEVITSCFEHNSVLRALKQLESVGVKTLLLDCELKDFHLNLKRSITDKTKLVAVTAMSNVTGQSPNLIKIGQICKQNNLLLLVDGAQSSGHINIDLTKIDADMYAFAGHKGFCAITGVGGLLVKSNIKLKPLLYGGTGTESENLVQPNDMPEGLEAGTLPTIPIASLLAGVKFVATHQHEILQKENELSAYFYNKLKGIEGVTLYSTLDSKNVFSFNVKNLDSNEVADILNEKYGVCVRAGLHCAPLAHKKLGTLKTGAVRASIDFNNTKHEIDYFARAIKEISFNAN